MKKIFGVLILGTLLSGCADGYTKFQEKHGSRYKYVEVRSPSTGKIHYAAHNSYSAAEALAKKKCRERGAYDCIIYKRGNTYVYNPPKPLSKEDKMIVKAQNLCKKIGVTPGTDKFIDCTIKMMSTSTGQQTVIVGQRKRTSIYPLHCRQMGGASNC